MQLRSTVEGEASGLPREMKDESMMRTALMTVHELDAAAVRAQRLWCGIREPELEALLDLDAGAVAAWEELRAPIAEGVVDLLDGITAAATLCTAQMIAAATESGRVTTYTDDDEVLAATDGLLELASVHRACAGRAAIALPDIAVGRRAGDDVRDGWLMCVAAACGMGQSHVFKWLDVSSRRVAQRWLNGDKPTPPGVIAEMREITDLAGRHTETLRGWIDVEDPVVWVCRTEEQMARFWPDWEDLPLPTHQVCAAIAAQDVPGTRLVFLPG